MASYYAYMSALFDPGAGNVAQALKIYEEMQERNEGCLAAIVEEDGDRLWIHHDKMDPQGDVVGHAVGFVAECARRFILTGTWSASWSNDCSKMELDVYGGGVVAVDLATQAVTVINSDDMLSMAQRNLEEVVAMKVAFPVEVAMPQDVPLPTDWLKENIGDDWGCYTRAVTVDDQETVDERVFQFKTAAHAVAFKLMFGGVAQQ